MLAGIIFGLGMSELALILVFVILVMGPQRLKTIKPLLKVLYKNYVGFMGEVDSMQGEMDDMKKTIMEPIEDVQREAEEELKAIQKDATSGLKGTDQLNQGIQAIIDRSKREISEVRDEAKMTGMETKSGNMPGASMARGGHVGMLGKQQPGSSRRMPSAKPEAQTPLASSLSKKDKNQLFGAKTPARSGIAQRKVTPQPQQKRGRFSGFQRQGARQQVQPNRQMPQARGAPRTQTQPNRQMPQARGAPRAQAQPNRQMPQARQVPRQQKQQNIKPEWPSQQKPVVSKQQPVTQQKPVKKQVVKEVAPTKTKPQKKKVKPAATKKKPSNKKGKKSKKR